MASVFLAIQHSQAGKEAKRAFNTIIYDVAKRTLQAPPTTVHAALLAESHLPLLEDITHREWMRLAWKLQLSPYHNDLAVRIF